MTYKDAVAALAALGDGSAGVFRAADATAAGVSRKQLAALCQAGVIARVFPGIYRITAVAETNEQLLRAALLWAGDDAAAAGRSAAELYGFEGVTASRPEIVVPPERRARSATVVVHHAHHRGALMTRTVRGVRVTGVEPTLVALAHSLEPEAFEIACEDARRRGLTSVAAIGSYLERWGRRGRPGVAATRALMAELDPVNASRSALEVKTRRLLVANDLGDFTREFPLDWNGRTYRYDFAFERPRVILEVNGRRWRRSVHRTRRDAGETGLRRIRASASTETGDEHVVEEPAGSSVVGGVDHASGDRHERQHDAHHPLRGAGDVEIGPELTGRPRRFEVAVPEAGHARHHLDQARADHRGELGRLLGLEPQPERARSLLPREHHRGGDLRRDAPGGRHAGVRLGPELVVGTREGRRDQRRLVGKVTVEPRARHAGLVRDLGHGGPANARARQAPLRRVEQPVTGAHRTDRRGRAHEMTKSERSGTFVHDQ